MNTKKVVWLSALKYVVPAEYESFLEEMAQQGWNIQRIGPWSSVRMVFTKTVPKVYRYVYDAQLNPNKEYRALYEQFGWEFMGIMASCCIWRKEYTGERPEAFSDEMSIQERNKRVIRAVSVAFCLFLMGFLVTLIANLITLRALTFDGMIQYGLFLLFTGSIGLYLFTVMRRIKKYRDVL